MVNMVRRQFWLQKIAEAWKTRNVIWFPGVRRAGKTSICRGLENTEYFDCELPRIRRMMDDPERFLGGLKGKQLVLDEIHRLENPSELLKIAADYFPGTRVLATGSSTLGATRKFRDTLTDRKAELWLPPLCLADLGDFLRPDLEARMLRGGLPPFFLPERLPEEGFQEWMDAFWAKDIQELFRLERRHSFLKFVEMILAQSGGIFEATHFAAPCEISRQTVSNYLSVLEATFVAHVIRPYSSRRPAEIVRAPKVYGFDTGFVAYYRNWDRLRQEDRGILWEHLVLNEMHAAGKRRWVRYWRDKQGHEIDFVLVQRGKPPLAVECKWSASDFDGVNLRSFRLLHPQGENLVVASDVSRSYTREFSGMPATYVSLAEFTDRITGKTA